MKLQKTELLAPAGSMASLHAAVSAGADAVYLGLEAFNARRGADNFNLETLEQACDYAHLRAAKVYLALNTLVLPSELAEALETARQAYRKGVDAFIVQDIGLASEIRRTLPEAIIHISTQMNTHSLAGLDAARALGAKRVTLARELSLEELQHLADHAAQLDLELECFVHGALCLCYSGQCFMSSMIGGRSANRGLCAQACRLPYTLHNKALRKTLASEGEHLLSPKDLCAIDVLLQLYACGVSSFKIEGRMKSPEYVYTVTSIYRRALDRIATETGESLEAPGNSKELDLGVSASSIGESGKAAAKISTKLPDRAAGKISEEDKLALAEVFSRGFTTAYLEGQRSNSIMSYGRPNNRGAFIGRVLSAKDGTVSIAFEEKVTVGDVLEFWTNKGHFTHEITTFNLDRNGHYSFPLARAVGKGDRVFRLRRANTLFIDDPDLPKITIRAKVELKLGSPLKMQFSIIDHGEKPPTSVVVAPEEGTSEQALSSLVAFASKVALPSSVSLSLEGGVLEAARTKAISEQEVRDHIDRLGGTPFSLGAIDICLDEGVGLGFSQLHKLRTEGLKQLAQRILEPHKQRSLPRITAPRLKPTAKKSSCQVAVWATNPACARAAKRAGADAIYVPALFYKRGQSLIAGQISATVESVGYPKQSIIALPVISHDSISPDSTNADSTKAAVVNDSSPKARSSQERNPDMLQYMKPGNPLFVENLGQLVQSFEQRVLPEVGPHIPVLNPAALQTAARFGAQRVWLSPELNLRQIEELATVSPVSLGLTIIGHQELMTTEHCLLMSQGPCNESCMDCQRRKSPHYIKDRKGYEFPVVTDYCGRSHLFNAVEFDVAHTLADLVRAGVTSFMVDTTMMNVAETTKAVERAVRACNIAKSGNVLPKKEGATTGHLFRGII